MKEFAVIFLLSMLAVLGGYQIGVHSRACVVPNNHYNLYVYPDSVVLKDGGLYKGSFQYKETGKLGEAIINDNQ